MKRVLLLLATNFAILFVASITLRLLGLEPWLNANGINFSSLLVVGAVLGFGGAFVSLAISKWVAKRMMGVRLIEQPRGEQDMWLVETVRRLASQAGIGMPEVGVFDSPSPNAFATGARRDAALVAVSSGLLQRMNRREVEAVLGHEVTHVANGDMVTLTLIQGVVNTFVFVASRVIGEVVDRIVFRNERGQGPAFWITTMIAQLVLSFLATMVVMWFSRQREFRADRGSANLLGSPQPMIAALSRLGGLQTGGLPDSVKAFGISSESKLAQMFATHPPIEVRIAALQAAR